MVSVDGQDIPYYFWDTPYSLLSDPPANCSHQLRMKVIPELVGYQSDFNLSLPIVSGAYFL